LEIDPMDLKNYIRNVPDFPKPGIMFRDITPLLATPAALRTAVERFADQYRELRPSAIVAAESRGFIFAAPLALALNVAFVPVRKPGKLPFNTHQCSYDLEYGSDTLEIHTDAVEPGSRVLLVDDLLATGGTMEACASLVRRCGAEPIAAAFLIELTFLPGRKRLENLCEVFSLVQYHDET
jgi:adenine phosphoribosyltransferase